MLEMLSGLSSEVQVSIIIYTIMILYMLSNNYELLLHNRKSLPIIGAAILYAVKHLT